MKHSSFKKTISVVLAAALAVSGLVLNDTAYTYAADDKVTAPASEEAVTGSPSGSAVNDTASKRAAEGSAPATTPAVSATPQTVSAEPPVSISGMNIKEKSIVLAPGKAKTFVVNVTPASAAAAASASALNVGSKQAFIKVTKVTTGDSIFSVRVKAVKKKALKKRGKASKVTVTYTNPDGKAVSKSVNVYVQNKAKKLKAVKKAVTLKKGKTLKVKVKVLKAQNVKNPVTGVKATVKKVAKVKKVKAKPGKIVVTLRGARKGSGNLVVKAAKKSVKIKVTVK